jgi:hypothetical protein
MSSTYRPLGHDSRDLTFFADDDSATTAYIISTTNTNADMNIYQLTANWTAVQALTATILTGQFREAPAMVKRDGSYYLFTSHASGWYPSTPNYITSTSIASGWSDSRIIGNTATWASQSGGVVKIGNQYEMASNRWGDQWNPPTRPTRQFFLPISFTPAGSPGAHYHFYPTVKYQDDGSTGSNNMFGVQPGRLLSLGKTVTSTPSGGSNPEYAVDGAQDNGQFFTPGAVPFTMEIDLGAEHTIASVDMTTHLIQGSETYYQFNVTGSTDRSQYSLLADQKSNTVVGFVRSAATDTGKYRYVKISVDKVINTNNGNEADFARGVHEVGVYGT